MAQKMRKSLSGKRVMTINVYTEALYAVAVRDGADLLLLLTVRRAPPGDVYVSIPYQEDPEYKPHAELPRFRTASCEELQPQISRCPSAST